MATSIWFHAQLIITIKKGSNRKFEPFESLSISFDYARTSSFTETAILNRMVNTKNPVAQTPRAINISGIVGIYSFTWCKGLGTKPPEIMPSPLSIQVPTKVVMQATVRTPSFFRVIGFTSRIMLISIKTMDVHIQGTKTP